MTPDDVRRQLDSLNALANRLANKLNNEDQPAATLARTGRDLDKVLDVIDALEQAGEIQ
jgi:hypothetical protein